MLPINYQPCYPLSIFVESLWFHKQLLSSVSKERILPQGTSEIIFTLEADFFMCHKQNSDEMETLHTKSILIGPHSDYFISDNTGQGALLGIHFKPGGILPFINGVSSEFLNTKVPLETLWNKELTQLNESLNTTLTTNQMFNLVEKFLLARLKKSRGLESYKYVLSLLNQTNTQKGIYELEAYLNLSPRRFRQRFTELVGLAPKKFEKLRRFNTVLKTVAKTENINWSNLALDNGYFDQAHFINDFRAYTGVTPSSYMQHNIRHPNHIPLS